MRATHSGLIKFTNTAYTIVNAANLQVGSSSNENSLNGTHFFTPPGSSAVNYDYELAGSTLTLGSIDGSALGVALYQSGGTLAGTHKIASNYYLSAGNLNSTGTTTSASGGSLTLANSGQNDFNGRTIENLSGGTVNWTDGDLRSGGGGLFNNFGTFNDSAAPSATTEVVNNAFSGTALIFTNKSTGTYNKTGAGETRFDVVFNNDGTVNVQQGTLTFQGESTHASGSSLQVSSPASVRFQTGTSTFNNGTISGTGTLRQDSGTIQGTATFGTAFEKAGGLMDGNFTFSNYLNYSGGSFSSTSQINLTGTGSSSIESSSLSLPGTTITVGSNSTLNWKSGPIYTGSNGGLTVNGIMLNSFDGSISESLSGDGFINVSGQFRKTGGTGVTTVNLPSTISGRFEAHTGSVTFAHAGTSNSGLFDVWSGAEMNFTNGFTFNNDTTAPNGGNLNLKAGTFNINDTVSLGKHASVTGGTLTGTHTLSGSIVVNGGSFDNSGTTTVAANSQLELAHSEANLMPRNFINKGKILWSNGNLTGSGNNSLTNDGEFAASTDGTFAAASNDFSVTNNGKFKKIAGTGTTTINLPFTNNGTVGADTGILHFADSFTFSSGEVALGGGKVTFAQTLSFPASAKLSGNGTITGNVQTSGTVAPGNSIGTVNITGDLTLLASSKSVFEVDASTTTGTADLVNVSGNLVLGGNLSWSLLSTLDPVSTSMFTLYTANNISGSFANAASGTHISTSNGQRSFIVNYGSGSAFDANKVIFSNFEFTPVPEPSTWALMFTGLMLITWQSRRRRRY